MDLAIWLLGFWIFIFYFSSNLFWSLLLHIGTGFFNLARLKSKSFLKEVRSHKQLDFDYLLKIKDKSLKNLLGNEDHLHTLLAFIKATGRYHSL